MNFLSPDDIFIGMRRKSLCNGALLTLTANSKNSAAAGEGNAATTPKKNSKKERRRGSFNEAIVASNSCSGNTGNGSRRSSLVSRWFKHISDAAEQYKPRSKNASHEPVDDPAIATIPHSNTKESLELTPERLPPISATATVATTPLAPMLPVATATNAAGSSPLSQSHIFDAGVQLRTPQGRRESTPVHGGDSDGPAYQNVPHKSHELSPAVNRTMSTRSCGEANNNYGHPDHMTTVNGVTLRHTQSARQAGPSAAAQAAGELRNDADGSDPGGPSKRDSVSIVYSNNSNNTRTLMQSSLPLVEPTAIQISISPAHTAEPVLTPTERLRRLDALIRDGLLEKQKIICDMFRLPVEHFHEIVDIAAMPEAPKDSADIVLAAYAQVQSLTEILNECMHVTPQQEISAVSTAVCDRCHEKQQQHRHQSEHDYENQPSPAAASTSARAQAQASPLSPSTKHPAQSAQQQTPMPTATKMQTPVGALDEGSVNIHEDDDGYCEIDELRLPALPAHISAKTPGSPALGSLAKADQAADSPPPLPPPVGRFKTPPAPPAPPAATSAKPAAPRAQTPELVKRQSTISTESIPEESADDLTEATSEPRHSNDHEADVDAANEATANVAACEPNSADVSSDKSKEPLHEIADTAAGVAAPATTTDDIAVDTDSKQLETKNETDEKDSQAAAESASSDAVGEETETCATNEEESTESAKNGETATSEAIVNAAVELLEKINLALPKVDNFTQTQTFAFESTTLATSATTATATNNGLSGQQQQQPTCRPNRLQHANSLEPSVPCHALNSIVSALNAQISLLLPKINERDTERERLRKENQHLRELLNAMHERQRVENRNETPVTIKLSASGDNDIKVISDNMDEYEIDNDEIDGVSSSGGNKNAKGNPPKQDDEHESDAATTTATSDATESSTTSTSISNSAADATK